MWCAPLFALSSASHMNCWLMWPERARVWARARARARVHTHRNIHRNRRLCVRMVLYVRSMCVFRCVCAQSAKAEQPSTTQSCTRAYMHAYTRTPQSNYTGYPVARSSLSLFAATTVKLGHSAYMSGLKAIEQSILRQTLGRRDASTIPAEYRRTHNFRRLDIHSANISEEK